MAENITNFTHNLLDVLELLSENEVESEMGAAFASFMSNPSVTWAKFVLTDDKTNANGERIPKEEFKNLLRSGIYMPVKMALGEISAGHPGTKPLGTITHLKEVQLEDGASAIVAIAALWGQERPADVEFIKQRMAEKKPVDVSWEILYEDAKLNTEKQSMDLMGTALRAATIVGNPAYEGRTPFLSISAKKVSEATFEVNTNTDPANNSEDELMEKEQLEARVAELEPQLSVAQAKLTEAQTALSEKDAEIARLTEENTAKETELTELRQYKASIEDEVRKAEKLDAIKAKFVAASITKDDKYFEDNAERFLKMEDDALDFFVQEMASNLATEASKETSASKDKTKIPALTGNESEDFSPKSLAKYLRDSKKNQK
jgi:hypothetical protein